MRSVCLFIAALGLLGGWLSGCVAPSPTTAPVITPTRTLQSTAWPTPTISPTPGPAAAPAAAPTATPTTRVVTPTTPPTATPTPSPTAIWRYWPNASDFRALAADANGNLWLGALSGLARYRPADASWQVWTTADGLPDNTVESVVIWDEQVWVGTQGGVARFDPQANTWRSYTLEDGLPGVHNIHLYLDERASTLWAGTADGLARYLPTADRWQSERNGPVWQLWADANGLWIAVLPSRTQRGGLYRLDKTSGRWQDIHLLADSPPVDAYALTGNERTMWAVGTRGVYACDLTTLSWKQINGLLNRTDLFFQHPAYHDGRLWLPGNARLVVFQVGSGQISRIPYPEQPYFYPQYPPVWIGSTAWIAAQSGLYALEGSRWHQHARVTPPAQIVPPADRAPHGLWVNTANGPGLFDPHRGTWTAIPVGKTDSQSWSIADPLTQWAFDARSQTLVHYDEITSTRTLTVPEKVAPLRFVTQAQSFWFVGQDALAAFDPLEQVWQTFALPNDMRIEAAAADENHIWLVGDGSAQGSGTLARFDLQRHTWDLISIPYDGRWQQLVVTPQTIWLGGETGQVLAFEPAQRRWQGLQPDPTCLGSVLYALAADGRQIWAGGERGVWQFDRAENKSSCLTTDAGMLDNRVEQIVLSDDGWVWFFNRWRGLWGYGPYTEVNQ